MNTKQRRRKTIIESEWWFEVEFRFEGSLEGGFEGGFE